MLRDANTYCNCLRGGGLEAGPSLMRQYFVREAREVVDPLTSFHKRGKKEEEEEVSSSFFLFLFFSVTLTVLLNRNNRPRLFQCSIEKNKKATQTKCNEGGVMCS